MYPQAAPHNVLRTGSGSSVKHDACHAKVHLAWVRAASFGILCGFKLAPAKRRALAHQYKANRQAVIMSDHADY